MMKFYKIMFFNSLIFGSLITMSSYSWFFMWMGLEINLLSFIPFMYKSNCCYSSESTMKYFIVQAMASTLLLFSIITLELNQELSFMDKSTPSIMILFMSLMMKLGLVPVHSWFPEVSEGLDWFSLAILLTWQKLAPMSIFMSIMNYSLMIAFMIIASSLLSGMLGMNQISTRKILAYSSINHMSWMIFSMIWSFKIWLLYFLVYSMSNFFIIKMFYKFNMSKINQINSLNLSMTLKMCFFMNFLSLMGLPPMIGFLPKWMAISLNSLMGMELISIILILSTLMSIFFYMRMITPMIFLKTSLKKIKFKTLKLNFFYISMNFIFLFSLPISNIVM